MRDYDTDWIKYSAYKHNERVLREMRKIVYGASPLKLKLLIMRLARSENFIPIVSTADCVGLGQALNKEFAKGFVQIRPNSGEDTLFSRFCVITVLPVHCQRGEYASGDAMDRALDRAEAGDADSSCWIAVTNTRFSAQAKVLAKRNDTNLCSGRQLADLLFSSHVGMHRQTVSLWDLDPKEDLTLLDYIKFDIKKNAPDSSGQSSKVRPRVV